MPTTSERVRIESEGGALLAGIIDRPAATPTEYAIFGHCFTCSKDSRAAVGVSRALAARGVGVLRLDFTGLGDSEGDFGDVGFGRRLADLEAAAGFLRRAYGPPRLLIGHSLGGAAALAVTGRIDDVRAVVTIGAPSDTGHLARLLREAEPEIARRGEAEVDLGGRGFRIRRSFLEELEGHDLIEDAAALGKALLVLHAPDDEVVPVDHATRLFAAARQPKSFVALDGADHLLGDRDDAEYAAAILGSWARRYLDASVGTETDSVLEDATGQALAHGEVEVEETGEGKFRQRIRAGRHGLVADEPEDAGGDDTGPSPYELLSAALGACTSMTLRMYADRKGWPLEQVRVRLRHRKVHAEDCADCESAKGKLDEIEREIHVIGDLDETQRERLLQIADRCPVHRTLHEEVKVRSRIVEHE